MITFSIIQKSQLEGAKRIDAEYYCQNITLNKNYVLGKDATSFIQYGTSEELNEENKGFPVLRLNEFKNYFIDRPIKFCNKITSQIFESLKLKKGDVLVCRTNGNPQLVGKAGIVMEDTDSAFASYLYRLRPNQKIINPASLTVFLNSKYGRQQIEKYLMPSIQSNFSPAKFKEIRIPLLSKELQNEVQNKVENAFISLQTSEYYYSRAESMLLEELGLSSFAKAMEDEERFYVVNFSDLKTANRMDAEFFQLKYEKLISKIKSQNSKPFLDFIQNVTAKFEPMTKPNERFKYVELANINSSIGIIDGYNNVLGKEAPSRAKRLLKQSDIIVSSVEGSLEKVALVDKEQEGYLASTGFFQLRSREILPEVLLILAKSIVIQIQLQKYSAGTILTAVPKDSLKNFIIPILPQSTQQKIADLVKKSHEARKKSKELLEKAKRKVEEMIERGVN